MDTDCVITRADSVRWVNEMNELERDYEEKPHPTEDGNAAMTGWPYGQTWNGMPCAPPVVDNINPHHYKFGKVECIDAIESALTPEEFRGYLKGTVYKYLWRERFKGQDESIKKAQWFLQRMVK